MADLTFDEFLKVDIRVGQVVRAEAYPEARKPAIKMWVDFGDDIGEKKTSAQVTAHYTPESLIGTQVVAVVNFPARQIGKPHQVQPDPFLSRQHVQSSRGSPPPPVTIFRSVASSSETEISACPMPAS